MFELCSSRAAVLKRPSSSLDLTVQESNTKVAKIKGKDQANEPAEIKDKEQGNELVESKEKEQSKRLAAWEAQREAQWQVCRCM